MQHFVFVINKMSRIRSLPEIAKLPFDPSIPLYVRNLGYTTREISARRKELLKELYVDGFFDLHEKDFTFPILSFNHKARNMYMCAMCSHYELSENCMIQHIMRFHFRFRVKLSRYAIHMMH